MKTAAWVLAGVCCAAACGLSHSAAPKSVGAFAVPAEPARADWSRDGAIAFGADEGILVWEEGRKPRRIANRDALTPRWSPDGTRLAFLEFVREAKPWGDESHYALAAVERDGSGARTLADPAGPSFTWSAERALVLQAEGGIEELDTRSAAKRRVGDDKPMSSLVGCSGGGVFGVESAEGLALYDARSLRLVRTIALPNEAGDSQCASADAVWAVGNDGSVHHYAGEGRRDFRLGGLPRGASMDPSGARLAVAVLGRGLFLVDAGGNVRKLDGGDDSAPSFSADGRRLAFWRKIGDHRYELLVMDVEP